MTFSAGTKLGTYEIAGLLGSGGMGEVYRARDSRLKRDVAIKVLPTGFSRDAETVARFRREAEVLASLNHPNIAVIHDFAETSSYQFLVMELVEGENLADRLKTAAIPVDESLRIAQQIAEALEAAHEKGIVHRDLKPANVRVTPEGRVKVLDFGLAKIQETSPGSPDFSNSPTVMGATGTGVILGTTAYMSPEQARGKPVDKRTDIWAFGVLLYEMLSGKPAFPGDSIAEIMVSVLTRDVDWQVLPPTLPTRIVDMLRRCLQRDASRRLRDIGDARLDIEEAAAPGIATVPTVALPKRRMAGLTLLVAAAALIIGALVGVGLKTGSSSGPPSWTGTRLGGAKVAMSPRISQDGKTLAFIAFVGGLTQVAVMNPESGDWKFRTEDRTRGFVAALNWSPDSTRIYFDRYNGNNRAIFSVPALGGAERLIKENAFAPNPLPDGSLLVHQINERRETQVYRYWPQENREAPLPALIKSDFDYSFRVFPNGKQAVFWGTTPEQSPTDAEEHLYILDIEKQTSVRMTVEMQPASVMKVLAVTPDSKSVVTAVANGDLSRVVSIPVDGTGPPQTLMNLQRDPEFLDVGPDGTLYADQISRQAEILRFGLSGQDLQRVDFIHNPLITDLPLHLPDGRTLITIVTAGHRRLVMAAPGKDPTPFVEGDEETQGPSVLLGKGQVAFLIGKEKDRRIAIASIDSGRVLRRLQSVQARGISSMTASPDGKTIFFVESGTVWSVPAEDGMQRRIHAGDGVAVAPDGKSLTIQLARVGKVEWMRVDVESGRAQPIAVREAGIFPTATPPGPNAVGPDGRILMAIGVPDWWFYPPAIFDPKTGNIQRIPIRYDADMFTPGWTPDGKIIAVGHTMESTIWRFRPTK